MFKDCHYFAWEHVTLFGSSLEYEIVWRTGRVRDVLGNTVCRAF